MQLQEVVAITAALLEGQVPAEDLELVQGYVEQLKVRSNIASMHSAEVLMRIQENPSPVAAAIERRLNRNASTLSRIISPDTRLSLSDATTALSQARTSVEQSRETIAQARLQLATETYALHDLYRQVLATSIRLLEQTIHGSVARGTKAKAEYLALVAEGMAKKLGVQHGQLLAQVYSEDVQDTLKQRSGDARVEERAVRRKIDEAEDRLAQYRAGRGMEGMASEYAEILREMEKVKAEIARLEANKGR